MAATGEVRLLGRFSVRRSGREIEPSAFGGGQTRTLVRILATRRGELVSRDVLIDALWPRRAPAEPGASLNVLVNRARRALGDPSPLVTGTGGYLFADDESWVVDAEAFLASVADGRAALAGNDAAGALRAFRAALDWWRGEPLAEDAYADWADGYRSTLMRAHQECLEGAANAAVDGRAPGEAVVFAQRAVANDPLREAANVALVRALAAAGDQAGALAAFDDFRKRLGDELGLDPSQEAFDLQARIIRHEATAPTAPAAAEPTPTTNPTVSLAFVGRDAETDALIAALAPERGGMAVVAGRSGAGKSRLLAEVTGRLGGTVVGARAFAPEHDEPWSLARSLLREAFALDPEAAAALPPRAAVALADLLPEIEHVRSLPRTAIDAASRRALVLRGAVQLLASVFASTGVLVVDDLQWADPSSLELLRQARQEIDRLRVVLAYRPEEVTPGSAIDAFLAGRDALRIDALPRAALDRLIADGDLAELIATATDGTPFAVVEVMRALMERGMLTPVGQGSWRATSAEALAVAAQVAAAGQRRSVDRRMELHSPARRDLLRLLALIGREVPARVLASALGIEEAIVLADLDALTRSELTRLGAQGWATAHDVVRETVAGNVEAANAARLHAAIVQALAADDADPAELARHASASGDASAAALFFGRAAEQRLDRFVNDDAASLADRGLELDAAPAVRARLLETRSEARARSGDLPGARSDLRDAMSLVPDGPARGRLMSRMAMLAFGAEDIVRADELVDVAIAAAGSDLAARASALAVGALTDMNLGRPERAEARSEEALGLFERVGDAQGVADILDGRAMGRFLAGDITGALGAFDRVARLFEDAGNLLRVVTPRSTRGHGLCFAAQHDAAVRETTEALELARTLGLPEQQAYALWHRSESLSGLGKADEARADATEALAIAEAIGHRGWTTTALLALGLAHRAAGDRVEAAQALERSLALSEHLDLFASWGASRLASVHLAVGDVSSAAPLVERARAEGPGLAHYEARLVHAELVAARDEPNAIQVARAALEAAEAGGHFASVPRLRELAGG